MTSLVPLLSTPLAELAARLDSRTRALALVRAMHSGAPWQRLPAAVPEVAASAWQRLRDTAELPSWRLAQTRVASDGTTKLAVELAGDTVETVLIPAATRHTVCVSSQVGCTRSCRFCATATLGFRRNLRADEIVIQYMIAAHLAPTRPRNVVFMGMGEPMDNLDNVLRAVDMLLGQPAPALGAEQVTVSTSGVLPGIVRFLAESPASLALSLNGTTEEQRQAIMPHNRTWPLRDILATLRSDARMNRRRRYFSEYVLIAGHNDHDDDADRLVDLLTDLPSHVNLIPYNGAPGSVFAAPSMARVREFQARLLDRGLRALVRMPRGNDIAAACGQLVALGRKVRHGTAPGEAHEQTRE